MRALVVFYSKSGTTKKVAKDIAEELKRFVHVDIEEIKVERYEPFCLGTIRAIKDMFSKKKCPLYGLTYDPKKYDFLVIGSPVWGNSCAPPIHSYISELQRSTCRVAYFTAQSGAPDDTVVTHMKEVSQIEPSAVLTLKKAEIAKQNHEKEVHQFVEDILGMKEHPKERY